MSEPTFTTPPPVPSRLSPADFSARMNAFLLYFPTLQGEMSTAIPWMAAAVAKLNNVVAANAWVTGTTYTINQTVWSPSDLQIYKALTGHTSTVDPASDAVNWLLVGGFPASHIDRVDNPHGVTAAQVGALALSGGTMTGVLNLPAGGLNVDGHQAWDAGNHGSGSGLDADLLDGEHGAFYRNAGNLNAGTIPAARLPSIDAAQLEGDNAAFFRNASNLNAGTVPVARLPAATESSSGISERATQAEAQAGTNNTRFMTPLRTAQLITASGVTIGDSGDVSISSGINSASHGLGALPRLYEVYIRCVVADQGYSVGDLYTLDFANVAAMNNTIWATTSTVNLKIGGSLNIINKSNQGVGAITFSRWRLRFVWIA